MCLGIPGKIVEITDTDRLLAMVNIGGVKREINIACIVDEDRSAASCLGDWVLVHVGFALNRMDEAEAQKTLDLLQEISAMS